MHWPHGYGANWPDGADPFFFLFPFSFFPFAMHGLHLVADGYGCTCPPSLLTDAKTLAARCRQLAEAAGLTIVGEHWHTFPPRHGQPGGVTGMLLLAESHLALHTWPEYAGVTLDVYVCNFTGDNSHKAEQLMQALLACLQPGSVRQQRLQRGQIACPPVVHTYT